MSRIWLASAGVTGVAVPHGHLSSSRLAGVCSYGSIGVQDTGNSQCPLRPRLRTNMSVTFPCPMVVANQSSLKRWGNRPSFDGSSYKVTL